VIVLKISLMGVKILFVALDKTAKRWIEDDLDLEAMYGSQL
jgi:hypothetical protein